MQKALDFSKAFAEWTGLEPATSCVTGRHSNQLNYHSVLIKRKLSELFPIAHFLSDANVGFYLIQQKTT